MTLFYKKISSPVGKLTLVATHDALVAILWEHEKPNRVKLDSMTEDKHQPVLQKAEKELSEYFANQRTAFKTPLKFNGTEFQKNVWKALLEIPYGETVSYSDIAHTIGQPLAVRAVGTAIGRNPISIIIPCHRVIGKNGDLGGFAGTLPVKKALLELEEASLHSLSTW